MERIRATFRIPLSLYREAQQIAESRHETLTQVVIAALRDYRDRWGKDSPRT